MADRLSLKNDLEIAREIQQAMLPAGVYTADGIETVGLSRPANTVGGDFYDILPLGDGRVVVTVGDVAGKGSPAALLMALLLAMMRTLVDERLEPAALVTRLNVQVSRHAPGTRFITLLYAVFDPASGEFTYVNAGHMPPLLMRGDGSFTRLTDGGIALGMFPHSTYTTGRIMIQPDELVAIYSDGITEAENPSGRPFDEEGLETALAAHRHESVLSMGAAVVRAVEQYTADTRLADDLTILEPAHLRARRSRDRLRSQALRKLDGVQSTLVVFDARPVVDAPRLSWLWYCYARLDISWRDLRCAYPTVCQPGDPLWLSIGDFCRPHQSVRHQ